VAEASAEVEQRQLAFARNRIHERLNEGLAEARRQGVAGLEPAGAIAAGRHGGFGHKGVDAEDLSRPLQVLGAQLAVKGQGRRHRRACRGKLGQIGLARIPRHHGGRVEQGWSAPAAEDIQPTPGLQVIAPGAQAQSCVEALRQGLGPRRLLDRDPGLGQHAAIALVGMGPDIGVEVVARRRAENRKAHG
jgi:hypothetical protein